MNFKFKILSFIFLFSILSFDIYSENVEDRRNQILNLLEEEIKEVVRLNKQLQSSDPKLLVRMADLYLEKARLIKERENKDYLSVPPDERNKLDKKKYFVNSNANFVKAQKVCLYTLKRFRNFEDKAVVLYILAQNAKEYQDYNKSKKYFSLSLKSARPGTEIYRKAILATAESVYNNKNYSEAIKLYEKGIRVKTDRWWTKDAYNLAWCYYREKKYNQAVALLKEIIEVSGDEKFINMKPEAERDLTLFYAEMGKSDQAVGYYKDKGGDNVINLIKVGKYLNAQAKQAAAQKIFEEVLRNELTPEQSIEVHSILVPIYEKFGKDDQHLKSCQYLVDISQNHSLSESQKEVLDYQVKSYGAKIQKQITSKTYQNVKGKLLAKTQMAASYFNLSAKLDQKNSQKYYFLAGETYFAAEMYKEALAQYTKAQEASEKNNEFEIRARAVESSIAALDKVSLSPEEKRKHLILVYLNFIKTSQDAEKTKKVSQRLFNIYYEKNDTENCEKLLTFYKNKYPGDHGTIEVMLARIMDYYKNKKDRPNLLRLVAKIKSGEFQVSEKYAKSLNVYLLTMQFENVEKSASKGDKMNALKGYLIIYKDPDSNKEAKKNAAYNITTLLYELGNLEKTYEWAVKSLSLMTEEDIVKFNKTLVLINLDFFYRREFKKSAALNDTISRKLCEKKRSEALIFLKNNFILSLADNQDKKAKEIIDLSEKCGVSKEVLNEMKLEVAKFYNEEKSWTELNNYLADIASIKDLWPSLIPYYYSLQIAYQKNAQSELSNNFRRKIIELYATGKSLGIKFNLESLDIVASIKVKELYEGLDDFKNVTLEFPEKRFNDLLKLKFKKLEKITTRSLELLSLGSGLGLVRTYKYLIETYQFLINEINNFTPPDKTPEYIDSFKKGISSVVNSLEKKVLDYRSEALRNIKGEKILSKDNLFFVQSDLIPVSVEYQYPKGALIMDRGGK